MEINRLIREHRIKAKLSTLELSKIIGVSQTSILNYENGSYTVGQRTMIKFYDYFGDDFKKFIEVRACSQCGNEFLPLNSRQIYCSTKCSGAKVKKRSSRMRRIQEGEKLKDIVEMARKAGMSYGQYVALIR